jgi:cation diffusion facilitator family transporter
MTRDRGREVRRVLWVTLLLNCLVAATKLAVGILIQSLSMTADGIHSLLDGASNVVGLVAIKWAERPPDQEHPYGHRKFETLSCFQILEQAVHRFRNPPEVWVGVWPLAALLATMVLNLVISRYEWTKGKQLKSEFLQADALHTRTDFYGALLVLLSLLCARAGYPQADTIGALMVVAIIARAGYRIILHAFESLSDRARIPPESIFECVMGVKGIAGCHHVRSRGVGDQVYVDFHIEIPATIPTAQGHELQHAVMARVKECFPQVQDVVVHLEPIDASDDSDVRY